MDRYVALKRALGYTFVDIERMLHSYVQSAASRSDASIRAATAIEWASQAPSSERSFVKLRVVLDFAVALHAEDDRHELPPRDIFGTRRARRRAPHLLTTEQIRHLLGVALSMPPAGSITPHTWHYMFGLTAVTGLRVSEATALLVSDITPDGLLIRQVKFRKSRLVHILPSVRNALNDYAA